MGENCGKEFSTKSDCKRQGDKFHKDGKKSSEQCVERNRKYICYLCDKKFTRNFSLQNHLRGVHSIGINDSCVKKCEHCDFKTVYTANLKRHILMHSSVSNLNYRPRSGDGQKFTCSVCQKKYTFKKNLNYHKKKVHLLVSSFIKRRCPLCPFTAEGKNKELIYSHFHSQHNISMKFESKHFNSVDNFYLWKNEIEKETATKFIKIKVSTKLLIFSCHRTGKYRSRGDKKCHLKMKGSCKINAYCPSFIKANIVSNGEVKVTYQLVHVGHKSELRYIGLTPKERKSIDINLANKIPHEEILKGIQCSLSNSQLQSIFLTNKKDVISIEKSLNLNAEEVEHPFDPVSIQVWANSLKASPHTSLLLYKPQGHKSSEVPGLEEKDFFLILMTSAQKDMLLKYGSDILCVDKTPALNNHNFKMYTLLTVDETREGFPVAFMFTNRGDEMVMSYFFKKMKGVTGIIRPDVFMSDVGETVYLAWKNVMGDAGLQLFCTWHVLRAWRVNISSKIKSKNKRDHIYKTLKVLLYELDSVSFLNMLEGALKRWNEDEELKEFSEYFLKYYVEENKFKKWAYSYRMYDGINTNMSIDTFDKVLKYCYLRGKKIKSLDKTLCAILNVLDKLFDLIIKVNRGKLVTKLQHLRLRHRTSYTLDVSLIQKEEDTWQVLSSTGNEFYIVKKVKNCNICFLKCSLCNSCFHEFVCSCIDHAIKNNMCKHIHLVARSLNDNVMEEGEDVMIFEVTEEDIEETVVSYEETIREYDTCVEFEDEKKKFLEEITKLVEDNVQTREELDYVRNATINAMKSISNNTTLDVPKM